MSLPPISHTRGIYILNNSNNELGVQTSSDDGEAVCYLCLDGGADAQPLSLNCASRGTDAGFVHLACLTNYAASKSMQAHDMNQFIQPWRECPGGCHQCYQNELAIDIATEFVSFVRRQYPHDTRRQVETLYLKLYSLTKMLNRLQTSAKERAWRYCKCTAIFY
jgi:hypothetical protein